MFCQACGAKNAGDARFCNMCGAQIAAAGAPGGALHQPTQLGVGLAKGGAPARPTDSRPGEHTVAMAPMATNDTTSISLDAIGVRSSKKTWTVLGLSALGLLAVGALASYFYMRLDAKSAGAAAPEDPFTLGAPTLAEPIAQAPSTATPPSTTPTGVGVVPHGASPTATHEGTHARETRATHEEPARTATSMGTHAAATGTRDAGAAEATTATTQTATDTTASDANRDTTATQAGDGTAQDATGTDRDLDMELYQSRVRYLVRRYYVASAQRCFDHATANNPSIHGQVVVAMQIGANGYVTDANVLRNSTGDDTLGACLAGQARSWRLTAPPGGEAIQMNMPFSR